MRVSLQTVATHLGLSRSGISRALRNDPRIPARTKERVRQACKKLGYRPHALISELASSHWQARRVVGGNVIAYIDCFRSGDKIGHEEPSAREQRAAILGYRMETFRREEFGSSAKMQKILLNRGITDVILGPVYDADLTVELDWSKFICVQLLPGLFHQPLHSVVKDHFKGVLLAWQKAVEYGYQRVGAVLLDHPMPLVDDILRSSAVHACQRHFFPHLPALPPFHHAQDDPRGADFLQWVRANKPDAVIGFSDWHSYYFLDEFGYQLPYILLNKTDSQGFSGIPEGTDICSEEAINLLHFCRRNYQWGLPAQRIDHVIEPIWFEGNSLPRKFV